SASALLAHTWKGGGTTRSGSTLRWIVKRFQDSVLYFRVPAPRRGSRLIGNRKVQTKRVNPLRTQEVRSASSRTSLLLSFLVVAQDRFTLFAELRLPLLDRFGAGL